MNLLDLQQGSIYVLQGDGTSLYLAVVQPGPMPVCVATGQLSQPDLSERFPAATQQIEHPVYAQLLGWAVINPAIRGTLGRLTPDPQPTAPHHLVMIITARSSTLAFVSKPVIREHTE